VLLLLYLFHYQAATLSHLMPIITLLVPSFPLSFSCTFESFLGYCLALDMTAREQQEKAKKAGLPWTLSKG
jgi:hypothetical protein